MKAFRAATGFLATCLLMHNASAQITLAPPFTDHAVLQRDAAVPVWGWSEKPGVIVTVTYRGQTRESQANTIDGMWRVKLDPKIGRAHV